MCQSYYNITCWTDLYWEIRSRFAAELLNFQGEFNTTEGIKLYWKMNPKVHEQESSKVHNNSLFKYKEIEMRISQGATIDEVELTITENKWKNMT